MISIISINNNFTSTLQGKKAGVQITTDNGMAGSSTSIRIRGVNTLSGGADFLCTLLMVFHFKIMTLANHQDLDTIQILSL